MNIYAAVVVLGGVLVCVTGAWAWTLWRQDTDDDEAYDDEAYEDETVPWAPDFPGAETDVASGAGAAAHRVLAEAAGTAWEPAAWSQLGAWAGEPAERRLTSSEFLSGTLEWERRREWERAEWWRVNIGVPPPDTIFTREGM